MIYYIGFIIFNLFIFYSLFMNKIWDYTTSSFIDVISNNSKV